MEDSRENLAPDVLDKIADLVYQERLLCICGIQRGAIDLNRLSQVPQDGPGLSGDKAVWDFKVGNDPQGVSDLAAGQALGAVSSKGNLPNANIKRITSPRPGIPKYVT
eukprot:CAMPEP_0180670438 /NCGR_PEP_ID=MMETSP1037_2-20121125/64029_1 /TAXON_ID=632150 /ORGANISM="Azadinium spinosum, Strain 3D9" /LENGTH=107 /DNA_ID=CAMNT_0022699375 /DNA_START=91 /DNA_END=418 /DNA_ORIENTATION=+